MDTGGPDEPTRLFSSSSTDSDSDYQLDDDPEEGMTWGHGLRSKKKRTPRGRPEGIHGHRCHYCRQKKVEAHVSCSRCRIKYCGKCLRNRNGEDIRVETGNGVRWVCPKCRRGCGLGCKTCCTCVPCRNKNGLEKAGQIIKPARDSGFNNVHDYLIHLETGEGPSAIASRKVGRGWTKAGGAIDPSLPVDDKDDKNPQWAIRKVRSVRKRLVDRSSSQWIHEAYMRGASEVEEERSSPITAVTGNAENDSLLNSSTDTKVDPKDSRCSQFDCTDAAILRNNRDEDQKCTPVNGRTEMSQNDGLSPSSSLQHRTSGDNKDSSCQISDVPNAADKLITAGVISSSQDGSGSSSGMQSNEFRRDLELLYQRPFSLKQLHEMWSHITSCRPVMGRRQYLDGHFEEQLNEEEPLYLDHYPDLALKLTRAISADEKLKLLRGFFFWVQNADMDGAYRPWVTDQSEDEDTEECMDISGLDSKVDLSDMGQDEDKRDQEFEVEMGQVHRVRLWSIEPDKEWRGHEAQEERREQKSRQAVHKVN